ncbi:MAG: hypothetical protein RLZ86_1182 [Actinomycetota bacterium]
MRIVVLGSGGREEAIAWSLEWSTGADQDTIFVAPGNGGSSQRLEVDPTDPVDVVRLCRENRIDLVVIGPESAIEAGVVDALHDADIAVFGPTRAAGRLESSKTFCREFAARHGIPSPRSRAFRRGESSSAITWADEQDFDVVVKVDGLASGKGVVVPETRDERDRAIVDFIDRGDLLLEERLFGDEISLLAFTDGIAVRAMPPAQDHKRIHETDVGPNTGGMGVVAPVSVCPPSMQERIVTEILQPAIDGMRSDGTPYVGVIYAGVMLTNDGPVLIEFNCRFGDPEAQALLPLLETDLREVIRACTEGTLNDLTIEWRDMSACNVVLAAAGYPLAPEHGREVHGLDAVSGLDSVLVFHAGTDRRADGSVITAGGRVLSVTGVGHDLTAARRRAYDAVSRVVFDGRQFRRDIGWREIARTTGGYANSGVDIDEGNRAVSLMKKAVESTHGPQVVAGVGAFGGAMEVSRLAGMTDPVLVASTDGVGTKVVLAAECDRYDSIGHDIVNHCVNDVLVQGARPLFFLDYVASAKLSSTVVADIVTGMADACRANSCTLLGGETAEMPGVYVEGHFDVAGTIVGCVERSRLLPRSDIRPGDVLIGLASSGLHTNGYSLVRRIFAGLPLDAMPAPLTRPLGDALLEPHRSYLAVLDELLSLGIVKGLSHITGGGFYENLPRILPDGCDVEVDSASWPRPALFALIAEVGRLPERELFRTLNMGIGMVVVVDPSDVDRAQAAVPETTWVIGRVVEGSGEVILR